MTCGLKHSCSAGEVWSLNHWTGGEVPVTRSFHLNYSESSESLPVCSRWGTWEMTDLCRALYYDGFWKVWVVSGSLWTASSHTFRWRWQRSLSILQDSSLLLMLPPPQDLTREGADQVAPLEYNSLLSMLPLKMRWWRPPCVEAVLLFSLHHCLQLYSLHIQSPKLWFLRLIASF